ncbi:MAG: hypothetical protein IJR85_04635 [Synergistaceae bacterium]|nr:hypothetical protein [Synergistaceae bacterium]
MAKTSPHCQNSNGPENTLIWWCDIPGEEIAITRRIVENSPALYGIVKSIVKSGPGGSVIAEAREVLKLIEEGNNA